jgi:hypothetical protein
VPCNQDSLENSLGLLVARCLVEPKDGKAPVQVMNVSDEELKVNKGTSTTTAQLEPINVTNFKTRDTTDEPAKDTTFTTYKKPLS